MDTRVGESATSAAASEDIPADQWRILRELSLLLVQQRESLPHLMEQACCLLLRLFEQLGAVGALIHWQSEDYVAGETGTEFQRLRSCLDSGPDSDAASHGSYVVIAFTDAHQVAGNAAPPMMQAVLDQAATVISLSLESLSVKAERDIALKRKFMSERLIARSPVIAFIWSPAEGWPVIYVSENVSRLGYKAADFLSGRIKYDDIILPEDRERVAAEVKVNLDAGNADYEQVYRIQTPTGKKLLVRDWTMVNRNADNEIVTIEGLIEDITEETDADERARQRLELTNNLFIAINVDGLVVDVNDSTCELLGLDREELLGSDWLKRFVPGDTRDEVTDYHRSLFSHDRPGVREFENEILTATGERHRVHWYHSLERGRDGYPDSVVAFGADVSSVRKAEQLSRKYATLLMGNPNPILSVTLEGDVMVANDAAQRLLGDIANCPRGSAASWKKLLALALEPSDVNTGELLVGDRAYVFMVARNSPDGSSSLYGIDVTEQKKLSLHLAGLAENMPGAIFEYTLNTDGSDAIEYMNQGCEDIWEISGEQLQHDPGMLWRMIDPADLPGMVESVRDSAERLTDWAQEWRIIPPSGRLKWLRGSASPVRRSDGGTTFTTIVIDITPTKLADDAVSAALRKTIYVLSAALEARDPYTAGHERRVTANAVQIGREMGLPAGQLTGLELAAMVHDVGKIQIPAEILSKPGHLSKQEFELIKVHPVVGADLLQGIDFEWPISDIVRQHHERMDGSGYPDGLAGDDILIEARILAVADVLEAMASHRPYRPGLGIEKAAEEIRAGAGTRYDERVARVCLQLVADGTIHLDSSEGGN